MPAKALQRLSTPATDRGRAKCRQLLDIACAHFLAQGYDVTSMDAVVAQAGGSKATLYRYFESKQVLFAACIGHLCDEFLARLKHIDIARATLQEGLRTVLRELVEVVGSQRHVDFYRLVVAGSGIHGVGQAWYEHGPRVWHRLLRQVMDSHPDEVRLVAGEAGHAVLAEMIFDSLLSHLLNETVILQRSVDVQAAHARIEAIIGLLLRP